MIRFLIQSPLSILRILATPFVLLRRYLALRKRPWVHLKLQEKLSWVNRPRHRLERWIPAPSRRPSQLLAVETLVKRLAARQVRGLLVSVPRIQAGWAAVERLSERLQWLSDQGVEVVVYWPDGAGPKELTLAAGASRVALGKGASVSYHGIAAEKQYLGAALGRVGLQLQVWRRSEFKSAMEGFRATEMSGEERCQLQALIEAMDAEVQRSLQRCTESARTRLQEAGSLYDQAAADAGIVEAVLHADELPAWLDDPKASLLAAGSFLHVTQPRRIFRFRRQPYIAVIPIEGAIRHPRAGSEATGVREWIRKVKKDKRALGAVLLIDSPGGSALASEQIHREVTQLCEEKPVVALLANVAASGGYYIAAAADAVVASRSTITGSIGVIGAKLVAGELFKRLSVHADRVMTQEGADLFSPHRAMTPDESERMDRSLGATYERFLDVVSEGRGIDRQTVDAVARGRVWAGRDALDKGLVDSLGGRSAVLQSLAERLSLSDARVERLEWRNTAPAKPPSLRSMAPGAAQLERLAALELGALLDLASDTDPWLFCVDLPRLY